MGRHPNMQMAQNGGQDSLCHLMCFSVFLKLKTLALCLLDAQVWTVFLFGSGIPYLACEVVKLSVAAGLTLPHSNGVVEGKINKLKLLKRMGYGRAGFPLLRQRMLHAI